jgi:hypothetical protein
MGKRRTEEPAEEEEVPRAEEETDKKAKTGKNVEPVHGTAPRGFTPSHHPLEGALGFPDTVTSCMGCILSPRAPSGDD